MKFLFKHVIQHPAHYLALSSVFLIALILLFVFRFNPFIQHCVIYLVAGFYLSWGLYHHYQRGDLHFSVMLEYLIYALLAVLVATWRFS